MLLLEAGEENEVSVDSTRPCMAVPWLACALASECSVGGLSAGDETTRRRSASSELREGSAGGRGDGPADTSCESGLKSEDLRI